MRIWNILAVVGCLALIGGAIEPATASTITYDVKFTATDFVALSGPDSTISTVEGEFHISFDVNQDQSDTTSGITLDSLNMPLDSPIGFAYFKGSGDLWVGGTDHGVGGYGGSNDFFLLIDGWKTGHPAFSIFDYSTLTQEFGAGSGTVTVSVGPQRATPLPAASLLFISALGGLGFVGWRQRNAA